MGIYNCGETLGQAVNQNSSFFHAGDLCDTVMLRSAEQDRMIHFIGKDG